MTAHYLIVRVDEALVSTDRAALDVATALREWWPSVQVQPAHLEDRSRPGGTVDRVVVPIRCGRNHLGECRLLSCPMPDHPAHCPRSTR